MPHIKWSTPLRAVKSRSLTPIPNEIYLEIFDYIESNPQINRIKRKRMLSNMAFVCRFFCAIALPRIFRSLEFSGAACGGDGSPSHASFCRAINKRQEPAASLAHYIEECIFDSWRTESDDLSWAYKGFMGIYSQAISYMSNLKYLTLKNTDIDKRLLKTMCGLSNLQALAIDSCSFGDDITEATLKKITPLKVRSFSCGLPSKGSPSTIIPRIISMEHLEKFRSTDYSVTTSILKIKQNVLLDLDLEGGGAALLYNALENSPRLTSFRVKKIVPEELPISFALPKSVVPNLHTLEGPLSLLDLVPGRPLHTVILSGIDLNIGLVFSMDYTHVALLKQSTASIRVLHIPTHFYLAVPINEHFPTLHELQLHHSVLKSAAQYQKLIHQLTTKWPSSFLIDRFSITFGSRISRLPFYMDLKLQYAMFTPQFHKCFPNVTTVSFSDLVQWRKDTQTLAWQPFVPLQHHPSVMEFLYSVESPFPGDHNGFYEDFRSNYQSA